MLDAIFHSELSRASDARMISSHIRSPSTIFRPSDVPSMSKHLSPSPSKAAPMISPVSQGTTPPLCSNRCDMHQSNRCAGGSRFNSLAFHSCVGEKSPAPQSWLMDRVGCSPQLLRAHPQSIDQPTKSRPHRPSNRAIAPEMQWFLPN